MDGGKSRTTCIEIQTLSWIYTFSFGGKSSLTKADLSNLLPTCRPERSTEFRVKHRSHFLLSEPSPYYPRHSSLSRESNCPCSNSKGFPKALQIIVCSPEIQLRVRWGLKTIGYLFLCQGLKYCLLN